MENELELNLQKTEAIEKEISELESKKTGLEATDAGLQEAISAKKKQISELNADAARLKDQDKSRFDAARNDNLNAAMRKLSSQVPELANNAELAAKLRTEFSKFDGNHFNAEEIYNDLRFTWLSMNRDKAFKAMDEYERIPEEVRKQQEDQAAGGGAGGSDGGGTQSFTRDQIAAAELAGTKPEYVKRAEQGSIVAGGLISEGTKVAR